MRFSLLGFLVCIPLLLTSECKADTVISDGICHAVGGTYIYNLNLNNQTLPADKNKAGTEVRDAETLSSSSTYKIECDCLGRYSTLYRSTYYTTRSPLSVDATRSGYTYYTLNENLSIATSVYVLGRGFLPVPFDSEPNVVSSGRYCYAQGEEGDQVNLDTGSRIKLSFLVNKPFIGKVTVPGIVVADLYGGIDEKSSVASTDKLAEIRISGDIVVPQNCEIASGQSLEMDFGKIPTTEFSSTKGTAVTSHKVTKQILVQCTGMENENIVYSTFRGEPADSEGTMLKVNGNDDVGIIVYDKWDHAVNVNGGKMDMDMGTNQSGNQSNSLTFSAAPASATGAIPKPGTFEAYATVTLEIAN